MEKSYLLDALNKTAPALALRDHIPIFTHFCFDGENVTTYNDVIGIQTPCKTDVVGAVPGKVFQKMVECGSSGVVDLVKDGDDAFFLVCHQDVVFIIDGNIDRIFEK